MQRNADRHAPNTNRRPRIRFAVAMASGLVLGGFTHAQEQAEPSEAQWRASVEENAPDRPAALPAAGSPRQILVFSLFTGFNHTVIPNVNQVFQVLGNKSGAFRTTISQDIESLAAPSLQQFDVLVLNNNCSVGPRRDLLLDELERNAKYQDLTDSERKAKAAALEQSMLDFVRDGKGLVVMHGAPTLLNNSAEFTAMVGGAFDYHPKSQLVTIRPVEPNHPLLAAFEGNPLVHRDEPYCFKGAYTQKNFRPLLVIDQEGIDDGNRTKFREDVRYTAWIKPFGKGRVFYCSPSHYRESYESPVLLRFLLDGTQYAAGDLTCDDRALSQSPQQAE